MLPVVRCVDDVIDDVHEAGGKVECEEGLDGHEGLLKVKELTREDEWGKDKCVLGPLPRAHQLKIWGCQCTLLRGPLMFGNP